MPDDVRDQWVLAVLGFPVPGGSPVRATLDEPAFRRSFKAAIDHWRNASDDVDAQLNELRKVLLATTDKDLHKIAEFGLNGITGTRKVGLQKALREVDAASGAALAPAAAKAAQAAEAYRSFVASDPRVKACDAYPKIKTPIAGPSAVPSPASPRPSPPNRNRAAPVPEPECLQPSPRRQPIRVSPPGSTGSRTPSASDPALRASPRRSPSRPGPSSPS